MKKSKASSTQSRRKMDKQQLGYEPTVANTKDSVFGKGIDGVTGATISKESAHKRMMDRWVYNKPKKSSKNK